jgi:hypothetical protein
MLDLIVVPTGVLQMRLMISTAALAAMVLAGCGGASAAGPNVLVPQKGAGAPFGSRDPYTCSSTAYPKQGPIPQDMARQYATCGFDKVVGGFIYLAQNVKVEVGKGAVPRGNFYIPKPWMDPKAKVYPLRGSYDWYQCGKEDPTYAPYAPGKNCSMTHEPNATGSCTRTNFGDWKCLLDQGNPGAENTRSVPPPKA